VSHEPNPTADTVVPQRPSFRYRMFAWYTVGPDDPVADAGHPKPRLGALARVAKRRA
jgi:hypothetical protein